MPSPIAKLNLDFGIVTAKERCEAISLLPLDTYTNTQLEKIADYILFGKTEGGKALAVAKQIQTKKSSYKRNPDMSLEELLEKPTFHETDVQEEIKRSIYTNPKPTISRTRDGDIPGMPELWATIDAVKLKHEQEKDGLKRYYLKHTLIDLRKEQYYLKDLFRPTINFLNAIKTSTHHWDWFRDSGYAKQPLTVSMRDGTPVYCGPEDWEWVDYCDHTLNFTNPLHIYHLLDNYSVLRQHFHDEPWAQINTILNMLEKIIDETPLTQVQNHILIRKVDHEYNEIIAKELMDKFEVHYGVNYISTIWKHTICERIAETAKLLEDKKARINDKKCIQCQKKKPRNTEYFKRNARKPDGLSPVCIHCEMRYPPDTKFPVEARTNGVPLSELHKKSTVQPHNSSLVEYWKEHHWSKERGLRKTINPIDEMICTDSVLSWLKKNKYIYRK